MTNINPSSQLNPDSGFGVQANQVGERFANKDGSFNLEKTGYPAWKTKSLYSFMLSIRMGSFLLIIISLYFAINIIFTLGYVIIGVNQLDGFEDKNFIHNVEEVFYFSTQTFTTVGYGRINPHGTGANILSSIETMIGWLFFALVTGLFYGRATRPKAFIEFSYNALISPYRDGKGLMFRVVPYKNNHFLTNAIIVVNLSLLNTAKKEYEFYSLKLERSRIDTFSMNWTVVHPIDEDSPFLGLSMEDINQADVELLVQITGFDQVYSNTVMARTSYTFNEIIPDAKFIPMYHTSEDGKTTILELDKLNTYVKL